MICFVIYVYLTRLTTAEELSQYIDKDQLPLEYGGVSEVFLVSVVRDQPIYILRLHAYVAVL